MDSTEKLVDILILCSFTIKLKIKFEIRFEFKFKIKFVIKFEIKFEIIPTLIPTFGIDETATTINNWIIIYTTGDVFNGRYQIGDGIE